mmetsp:Transcript_27474/g.56258  ORF Transcript_27474/g.56258 Transcript_27474/m.56258 type:complete len:161 (+) Transcript_27474:307-789(+)
MIFQSFNSKSFLFSLVVTNMTIDSIHAQIYVVPTACFDYVGSASPLKSSDSFGGLEMTEYIAALSIIGRPVELHLIEEYYNQGFDAISNASQFHLEENFTEPGIADVGEAIRFYPTWSDGERCSSKVSTSFESWEESYSSLDECCDEIFSWDYHACMQSA